MIPTKWFYPSATSGPVPCQWEGWVDLGATGGWQWIVLSLSPATTEKVGG